MGGALLVYTMIVWFVNSTETLDTFDNCLSILYSLIMYKVGDKVIDKEGAEWEVWTVSNNNYYGCKKDSGSVRYFYQADLKFPTTFKVGDKVKHKYDGTFWTVSEIHDDGYIQVASNTNTYTRWLVHGDNFEHVVEPSKPKFTHTGHEIVDNSALGKAFKYCRTCKVEV